MSTRLNRRDLKHDAFVDEVEALGTSARNNAQRILAVGAGVLVVILIVSAILYYRSNREQKAEALLGIAINTMEAPLLPAPSNVQAPPTPGAKYKTEAERLAAAEKEFKAVTDQYSGTDAADVADLYLGRIAAGRGDVKTAQAKLKTFIDGHPKSVLAGGARYSLYLLRIENGEAKQVAEELEKELANSEPVLPADSLLALIARSYETQGNEAKMKEMFRRLVTEYPDSPYAVDAQRRLPPA
jgi:TolA-binding protein